MYRICVITKQNKNSPKHPAVGIWESWWCLKKGHFRSEFSKCLLLMEGLLDNHFLLWMTFKNSDHMALAGMSPRLMSQVLTPPKLNAHQIWLFWIYFWNILVRARREKLSPDFGINIRDATKSQLLMPYNQLFHVRISGGPHCDRIWGYRHLLSSFSPKGMWKVCEQAEGEIGL